MILTYKIISIGRSHLVSCFLFVSFNFLFMIYQVPFREFIDFFLKNLKLYMLLRVYFQFAEFIPILKTYQRKIELEGVIY